MNQQTPGRPVNPKNRVTCYVETDIYSALALIAERERRSVSWIVVDIIVRHLRALKQSQK